jgi:hypothetical protein
MLLSRQLADVAVAPPNNAEILDAARKIYAAHSETVDLSTRSGMTYAKSSEGQPKIALLNNYQWKSQQAAPITPTAEQIYSAPVMRPAVEAATANSDIWSYVVGISESLQLLVGEEGGIGIAFALARDPAPKGAAYVAGKLGLDIEAAFNVQFGLWHDAPAALGGNFYGIEVSADLGMACSLGIFATTQFNFVGFSIGIGVGVGGGATIVGGHTWVFG